MPGLNSLDAHKRKRLAMTLKEISKVELDLSKDSEMIRWIDGQFEDPESDISRFFTEINHNDLSEIGTWKLAVWLLVGLRYQTKRDPELGEELEYPEQVEIELLKTAAEIREGQLSAGKLLSIPAIAQEMLKLEDFKWKDSRGNKVAREVGGVEKQITVTIAKFRKMVERQRTLFEDMFTSENEDRLQHYLLVLSKEWPPLKAKSLERVRRDRTTNGSY